MKEGSNFNFQCENMGELLFFFFISGFSIFQQNSQLKVKLGQIVPNKQPYPNRLENCTDNNCSYASIWPGKLMCVCMCVCVKEKFSFFTFLLYASYHARHQYHHTKLLLLLLRKITSADIHMHVTVVKLKMN